MGGFALKEFMESPNLLKNSKNNLCAFLLDCNEDNNRVHDGLCCDELGWGVTGNIRSTLPANIMS